MVAERGSNIKPRNKMVNAIHTKIEALTKENYETWVIQAKAVLVKCKLWKHVENTLTDDAEGEELCKSELILLISPPELKQVKNCKTAKDIWQKLKDIYASRGPARKASLLKQLILAKLEDNGDIREHLNKFLDVVDKLEDLEMSINKELLSIMMLYSLSSAYENFRVAIESRDTLPTPEQLKIKIIEEYDARNKGNNEPLPSCSKNENEETFYAKFCKHCKKKGHNTKDCWNKTKRYNNKPKRNKNEANHVATCYLSQNSRRNAWILDSGCTSHMTYQEENFDDVTKITEKLRLASADHTEQINGRGKASIIHKNGDTVLKDTLFVPNLAANLLSVGKIADAGCTITFNKNKATVKDPNFNNRVTMVAERANDGLYYVSTKLVEKSKAASDSYGKDILLWHSKLGHMNEADMKYALKNESLKGLKFDYNETIGNCEICIQAKMKTSRKGEPSTVPRTTQRLEIVHTDVCGPIQTPTLGNRRYFVIFTDDYSRYSKVYFIKYKSEVLEKFKEYKEEVETYTELKIKCLQSDNGTEFCNTAFDNFLKQHGISRRLSTPYTPHQNGVAERKNRTLVEKARSMLIEAKAPMKLWGEAIYTANYLSNRSINKSIGRLTPFEKWVGRKPCINHLYPFGTKTFVLIKGNKNHKFASKAIPGMFAGYSEISKAFRIWVPSKNKIFTTKDVKVIDKKMFYEDDINSEVLEFTTQEEKLEGKRHIDVNLTENRSQPVPQISTPLTRVTENIDNQVETDESDFESTEETNNSGNETEVNLEEIAIGDSDENRRSLRDRSRIVPPQRFQDFVMAAIDENSPKEPETFKEAMKSTEKEKWLEAMLNEISSLNENKTWDLVNLPRNRKALPCKWIFKIKPNPDGSIERYKARLVIKGFSQKPGIDFDKTFSPVVRLSTVRALLGVTVKENLILSQFDVSTAFLNGRVMEEIYMKQPEGYNDGTQRVCRLNRSLYGLKQAPRCWNTCIHEFLIQDGFNQSSADPCLYIRNRKATKVLIALYVDDGLVASTDDKAGKEFIEELKSRFKITTKPATYFLGLEIDRTEDGAIHLCQKSYIKKTLEKFGMTNCKPVPTPALKDCDVEDDTEEIMFPYRQAVGALAYLMVATRPDIAYAVGIASRSLEKPTKKDIMKVKRILRYLKGTADQQLSFRNTGQNNIISFSDADLGGDQKTGHSTTGYICLYNGAVSWKSQKQATVAVSSTEAELVAATETVQEIIWLKTLLSELTILEGMPELNVDNDSAIKLAYNPPYEYHKRTKHIKLKHFYIRECTKNGEVVVKQVSTQEQTADMLTKPLFGPKLRYLSDKAGLRSPSLKVERVKRGRVC